MVNNPSYMTSEPARAPVWEAAALAPASEEPDLMAMTWVGWVPEVISRTSLMNSSAGRDNSSM